MQNKVPTHNFLREYAEHGAPETRLHPKLSLGTRIWFIPPPCDKWTRRTSPPEVAQRVFIGLAQGARSLAPPTGRGRLAGRLALPQRAKGRSQSPAR